MVLPILLLLFAGATDLGRLFTTYTTLEKGTSVGARYLSIAPSDTQKAMNLVLCAATDCSERSPIVPDLTSSKVRIVETEKYVTVRIDYVFSGYILPLKLTLTPSTTMRLR